MRIHAARHGLRGSRHRCCHRRRSRHPTRESPSRRHLAQRPSASPIVTQATARHRTDGTTGVGSPTPKSLQTGPTARRHPPRDRSRRTGSNSCVTSWQFEPPTGSHPPRSSDPRATFVQRDRTRELSHRAAPTSGSDRHVTGPCRPSETQNAQPRTTPSYSSILLTHRLTTRRPSSNERLRPKSCDHRSTL